MPPLPHAASRPVPPFSPAISDGGADGGPGRVAFWSVAAPCLSAFALLAAHAVRAGDWGVAAAWGVLAGLVCIRLAWARLVALAALFAGGLFWVSAGVDLVRFRMAFGMDWLRLAAIMAAITGLTMAAWWRLAGEAGRLRHHRGAGTAWPRAVAFLLTVGLLWLARWRASSIVLLLSDRFLPGSGPLQIALAGVYAAWAAGLLLDPASARKARPRLWALFSAVFFGQLALGLLGAHRLLMTGALHLPVPALILAGPLFRGEGVFMLVLFGVSVLLLGPAWCSHLCYIGAWDDACSRLAKPAAHKGRGRRTAPLPPWAVVFRWCLAAAVFAAAWTMGRAGVPLGVAATAAGLFGLAGVAVMAGVSSRRGMMAHCTAFCPMGAVGNLLGRISPWRLRVGPGCTRCWACLAVCRYNALDEQRLEEGRPALSCTLCRDCVTVCRHGAMRLTLPGVAPRTAWRIFAVLAAVLHAVFLNVARM
ncbi:4Fe-4S binding protein [Nitratidesulfovibrio sp. HK-II]|uniref:4Fe-4S binding protein n=1 Tax=Nitratidesulfovibrio sp. HK-II TaxID=2009266 RepID=UPI000EEBE107|nr:4Fe-4S dicluster domain-containing protein [Nitratidesulfovibrio sp. HK-II]GBO95482.1 polyferredoxin NapH [Nitratidesulfovibrio sp. HK-II]